MVSVSVIQDGKRIVVAEQGMKGMEISSASVKTGLNQISGCTLEIPQTNKPARMLTGGIAPVVEVQNDGRRVFIGSVVSVKETLFGDLEITCDGALSWLDNIVKEPFNVTTRTTAEYIETIINQYNAIMVNAGTPEKAVWFGGVEGFTGNVNIHHEDEYTTTLDLVKEAVEKYGGYFFETVGGGGAYPAIGWIKEPSISSGQVLEFGVNLASLENYLDFSEYASRVYAINNDGLRVTGGYVSDPDIENLFGRKDYAYKSQADTQAELDAEAAAILAAKKVPIRSIECTAAFLKDAGVNIDAMALGTTVKALDRRLGSDLNLMVSNIERDYINTADGSIVLGRSGRLFTDMVKR